MASKQIIAVMGDVGRDICQYQVEAADGGPSDRKQPTQRSFEVSSGASIVTDMLRQLLGHRDSSLHVEPILPTAGIPRSIGATQITLGRFPKHPQRPNSERVYRIRSTVTAETFPASTPVDFTSVSVPPNAMSPDYIVIHDDDGAWRQMVVDEQQPPPVLSAVRACAKKGLAGGIPRIFLDVDVRLPSATVDAATGDAEFVNPVWRALSHDHSVANNACVMCSSRQLRHAGAVITRHHSWEESVEDVAAELTRLPQLSALSRFRFVLIRFGFVAAILLERPTGSSTLPQMQLVFAPEALDGVYRDKHEHGELSGYKILLAAGLIEQSLRGVREQDSPSNAAVMGIKAGLLASMKAYDHGYAIPASGAVTAESILKETFSDAAEVVGHGYDAFQVEDDGPLRRRHDQAIVAVTVPDRVLQTRVSALVGFHGERRGDDRWQVLRTTIGDTGRFPLGTSHQSMGLRLNLGMAIARFGYQRVLNTPCDTLPIEVRNCLDVPDLRTHAGDPSDCITLARGTLPTLPFPSSMAVHCVQIEVPVELAIPVAAVGKMVLLDRGEIEMVRGARNLIRNYARGQTEETGGTKKPMSVAVFGAPGTGKSYAIRQIVDGVNPFLDKGKRLITIEFNVSQFRSVGDLESAMHRVQAESKKGIPVALFDEFDTTCDGVPFGWLKYFLAPMQDGEFAGRDGPIPIGPAILVFAGGVFHSFRHFADASRELGEAALSPDIDAKRRMELKERKAPDFVSRLLAHIDLVPIDRPEGMYKFVVRRAILLRSFLEAKGVVPKDSRLGEARIDEDVLYALLTIDRFHHGVRSMESIVRMCTPIDGFIEAASLPPAAQLAMHLDPREFYIRIQRGRTRRSSAGIRLMGAAASKPSNLREDGYGGGGKPPAPPRITPKPGPSSPSPEGDGSNLKEGQDGPGTVEP